MGCAEKPSVASGVKKASAYYRAGNENAPLATACEMLLPGNTRAVCGLGFPV
jgi:hypothetical protein